ncbi:aryl-sulfate sulfotransferase [Pseudoflavonifractor sp. MCC625]|uniref:aryl-sulfate sulfotransferase n=1 Tax=Pseudoflavonifractor sp. MCC625 TaxID=2592647 RepID=UPI001C009903|nr:aryl-sulfate sulfotransferase [Pseudoflavonifractor sp. MCC625]MBT9684511.1 hypothetical protein [Pseudoflavonifractor sp. MCC625]
MTKKRAILLIGGGILLVAGILLGCKLAVDSFLGAEMSSRDSWDIAVGEHIYTSEERGIEVYTAPCEASIPVVQMVPEEYEQEGFTYYDEAVQQRLAQHLLELIQQEAHGIGEPLAVLNPFGTGSNGLLLCFDTGEKTQIRYTVHTTSADDPDFTATAKSGKEAYTGRHCFLLIGLVPGETNQVTLEAVDERGEVQESAAFTVEMPDALSGYDTRLDATGQAEGEALSDGLFYATGIGDYYGYTFFFDNEGVLRYEMVLEGYHSDRFLWEERGFYTCVGSRKIALLNPLGQAVRVYDLGQYELHHDINWGPDGTILALVTDTEQETTMDVVIEIDLESGAVTERVDFSELMDSYCQSTRPISATDPFFWQAGERDWLHLNSIQYLEESDSIVVSSRETSTILQVTGLQTEPVLTALIGDPDFWAGTEYENLCYQPEGDFVFQYGQHDVERVEDESLPEGVYLLRMYNNNYWGLSTRDGYEPELDESVGTSLTDGAGVSSYIYYYRVDETNRTFALVESIPLVYSSIVSNVQEVGEHYVFNSGVAHTFGECDREGNVLRSFSYPCMMNGYRVMKDSFTGFWFEES